jgi:ABC-2 type transport system ATP-binding protein
LWFVGKEEKLAPDLACDCPVRPMNAVELIGVMKSFGSAKAVDDVSLTVPRGVVYGFIGPNGSGKTTTLRMIVNILKPDHGEIRVLGETRSDARSSRIGYLPEERGMYRRMRVRPFLRFYGRLKTGRSVDAEVERWIDRLALGEFANKRVEALSKGTSQRVQFIAAVIGTPELVILDEPFSGLDPVNAEVLRESILDLRRAGTTVILSTHDMGTAEQMCDAVFMIFRGRKVLDGPLGEIKARYGADTLRVRLDGQAGALRQIPDVESVRDLGQIQELRLARGADAQGILKALLDRGPVLGFEITQPSLHDIFVRIAGGGSAEGAPTGQD